MEPITIEKELDIIYDTFTKMIGMDISGNERKGRKVKMRWIFYKIVKELNLEHSNSKIGQKVGMDHAVVYHGLKHFDEKILKDPFYSDVFTKGLIACSNALGVNYDNINTPTTRVLKRKWSAQEKEINELREMTKRITENETLKQILSLDTEQFRAFEERVGVMLKSVQSIKTYNNTNRSYFNIAS